MRLKYYYGITVYSSIRKSYVLIIHSTQNFRDILTRRKRNSLLRISSGTLTENDTTGRFLTRSVRKNEISSETHEKTRKRQRRGSAEERETRLFCGFTFREDLS